MRENIGLMFGSFDPPHLGHVETAEKAQRQLDLKTVFMIPVPQSPSKQRLGAPLIAFEQKMDMCDLITQSNGDWLVPSDAAKDFSSDFVGCFQDLKRLVESFSENANTYIVCGDDFKQRLDIAVRVLRVSQNLANVTSACIPVKAITDLKERGERACEVFSRVKIPEFPRADGVSSTFVRKAIGKNTNPVSLSNAIPIDLAAYIYQNRLYSEHNYL